jgi:hypothetical protein
MEQPADVQLHNFYYDTIFVKWRVLGLGTVSKFLLNQKVNFLKRVCIWLNNVPLCSMTCNIIIFVYLNGRR